MERAEKVTLTLPANLKYAAALGGTLTAMLEETTDEAYNLQMAVHELFTNIVEHGCAHKSTLTIQIQLLLDRDCFTAVLQDQAPPFAPELVEWEPIETYWQTAVSPQGAHYTLKFAPEPDLLQVRGRGFFLIHQLMSSLTCLATNAGNEWTVIKHLGEPPAR